MTRALPALAVVGTLLLTACGGDPSAGGSADPGPSGTPTASASPAPTPSSTPTPSDPAEPTGLTVPGDDTWTPWAKGGPEPLPLDGADDPGFAVEGGGVTCLFSDVDGAPQVRCDRSEGLGVDQPRPADCQGAWGDAVTATAAGGELACVGDTVLGSTDRVLADGDAASYGELTCAVRDAAVQCLGPGQRGFVISRRVIVVR